MQQPLGYKGLGSMNPNAMPAALDALWHAFTVTIFDEPVGQKLVFNAPSRNAAHNGHRNVRPRHATPHGAQHGGVSMRAHAWARGWVCVHAELAAIGVRCTAWTKRHRTRARGPEGESVRGAVTHALALGPLLALPPLLRVRACAAQQHGGCCSIACARQPRVHAGLWASGSPSTALIALGQYRRREWAFSPWAAASKGLPIRQRNMARSQCSGRMHTYCEGRR